MDISFIGGGVMAEAMIGGILKAGIAETTDIKVSEPVEGRRKYLENKYQVQTYPSNQDVLAGIQLLVLAVKPQNLPEVMGDLNANINESTTVMSIVAGATLKALMRGLNHKATIRVIPNTPAQIGEGMSVWTASSDVPESEIVTTRDVLQTLGEEIYVPDEKYIDMATAVSASGPAYIFLFIESLIDAGVYLGMSRDMARTLTLQTVLGSARLVRESGRHPAELKDMVTSPGGTTAEALLSFEKGGFRSSVIQAVIDAFGKSQALGRE